MPQVSIIIPTNRPPEIIRPCLDALAQQRFDARELEVVVTYNGMPAPHGFGRDWPFDLCVCEIGECNISAAKNVALDHAHGRWVILLNDDMLPEPDFVATHLEVHRRLGQPAMVLGDSPWLHYEDETVFDRMIQTTSMIFFYDQLKPHAWYNFRHAWNLNLSLERRYMVDLRFDETLSPMSFEDLEWAFRMERAHGLRVWFAPEARALHSHRYTLDQYLKRETHMGRMAVALWNCNPRCYRAIYHGDLNQASIEFAGRFVEIEGRREPELYAALRRVSDRRPDELSLDPTVQAEVVTALYLGHLPLKRLAFRRGLLERLEQDGAAMDGPAFGVTHQPAAASQI